MADTVVIPAWLAQRKPKPLDVAALTTTAVVSVAVPGGTARHQRPQQLAVSAAMVELVAA